MAWYGGWDGPTSNTRFRACMDMRTSTQNETQGYVQIRRWVEATGSFAGTILDTSWADKVTLYNGGTYADSGWVNVGWVGYGTATTQSASASYTSGSGAYRSSSVSGSYAPAVPTWRPNACTNCVNVRNSDNKNTVSWTRNATTPRPYAGIYVDRQIDGGAWSRAATLGGGSSSWADSSTSANHAYRYRVLPYNSAYDASAYAYSETTYNTPAAPSKVTVARKAETTVTVTLDNPALTATALELQRSADGSRWATVQTVEGAPVVTLEDSPGGGTWYYRARNTRGDLASAWSPASEAVVTICPPAEPSLLEPASGVVIAKTQEAVTFHWSHVAIDGSAQTAAELGHSVDGGATWTTVAVPDGAQTVEVPNSFPVNSVVTWRVRTKGAHADWGPWSAEPRTFRVSQVPTVVVTSPASDEALIEDVPIVVSWSYDDLSGTQRDATVVVRDESGKALWSRTIQGAARSLSIGTDEILLPNQAIFTLHLTVSSTSQLSASAIRTFSTSYEEPATPRLSAEVDRVFGRVLLTVYAGEDEPGSTVPRTESLGIFRRNADGSLLCLADGASDGTGTADTYPPLDQELTYIAAAYTANGLTSNKEVQVAVSSDGYVFFNFDVDSDYARVAKMAMDVEWDTQRERDCEIIETEGDEDPLVFYGATTRTESSVSGNVWRLDSMAPQGWGDEASTAAAFGRLVADAGVKIVRFPHGDVMPAHVTCKVKVSSSNSLVASVDASIRKVRAYGLAV